MKRRAGFTLLELIVVIGIVGIMSITAMPLYRTYQQRAFGSEASLMIKRLVDGQILYYLENEEFFPPAGQTILINHNDPQSKNEILQIENALKILIPVGHFLSYSFHNDPQDPKGKCINIQINAPFPIFDDGSSYIYVQLFTNGEVEYF
jgi:prepilin-type N-terminal cleavage/methylation domain-containing protein